MSLQVSKEDLAKLAAYFDAATRQSGLFQLYRSAELVGSATGPNGDIYQGLLAAPEGFGRLAFDARHNTVVLFTSKDAQNLQGEWSNNCIRPTLDGMRHSYVIRAERTNSEIKALSPTMAEAMHQSFHNYCQKMRERAAQRFTLYTASLGDNSNFATNGRVYYKFDDTDIIFATPARRKNGHFIPAYDRSHFGLNSVTRELGESNQDGFPQGELAKHWQELSSLIWEEKSIYDENAATRTRQRLYSLLNYIPSNAKALTISFGIAAGLITLKDPAYALKGGAIIAALHALADVGSHQIDSMLQRRNSIKSVMKKKSIKDYGFNEDVSSFYKTPTAENLGKLCPTIDMERHKPEDFRFLNIEEVLDVGQDHKKPRDDIQPGSLRGFLLQMHMRGWSSRASFLDDRTILEEYQNGVIRIMRANEDRSIDVYGMYRPDACVNEALRLPDHYQTQFGGNIVKISYDRSAATFSKGISTPKPISYNQLMDEMSEKLFSGREHHLGIAQSIKHQSIRAVKSHFGGSNDELNASTEQYLSGHPVEYPSIGALNNTLVY